MKQWIKIATTILLSALLMPLLFSCNGNNNEDTEDDTLSFRDQVNLEDENATNAQKPILEYLRFLPEDVYGGVNHLKDGDFKIVDNKNRFAKHVKEDDGEITIILFKQLSVGDRNIFFKHYYTRYLSGPGQDYFEMSSSYLIGYKDGEWVNLSEKLPEKWKKNYYMIEFYPDNNDFKLFQIDFDKKTGKELNKKLIETAIWQNEELTVLNGVNSDKQNNYRIIVACSEDDEVSEDFNLYMDDIQNSFKNSGVYVEYLNLSKSNSVKIDDKNLTLELDIVELMKTNNLSDATYVFIEKGKKPAGAKYDMSNKTIKKAKEYFGIK